MLIESIQKAIRGETLDGWLFCNFRHRDALTDSLLSLNPASTATRSWYYYVPAEGDPVKFTHPIERDQLNSLPGKTIVYPSRDGLIKLLSGLSGQRVAVLSDPTLQILSTLDASSWNLFRSCGMELASAAPLLQRVRGTLDEKGIESHGRAAAILYRIVAEAWDFASRGYITGQTIHEREVHDFMLSRLSEAGLITDDPPIVASGPNSGNPHYSIPDGESGRRFAIGDVIQFDIWAKEPDGIYADISWVGYFEKRAPPELEEAFANLARARDLVVESVREGLASGASVRGCDLDAVARECLLASFPEAAIKHRTGHGIDTECHGSGVNLDSVEFPDNRRLLEGSCFSVEPGIYFDGYGMRTEIDIYIQGGKPIVSGCKTQRSLLVIQEAKENE